MCYQWLDGLELECMVMESACVQDGGLPSLHDTEQGHSSAAPSRNTRCMDGPMWGFLESLKFVVLLLLYSVFPSSLPVLFA